jgi:heat shock protein HslJ
MDRTSMPRFALVLALLACASARTPAQPASPAPLPLPFAATGNEPGWRLDIADGRITLVADYGSSRLEMRASEPQPLSGGRRYAGNADGRVLVIAVFDRVCEDDMTGMPRPYTVEMTIDEQQLKGCGGDPASLLQGAEWVAVAIDGRGLVDGSRVTLTFGPDGRVAGIASCNNYTGTYAMTGEGLTIGKVAATRKACAPGLMTQEQTALSLLEAVERFEIAEDGALVLHGSGGRTLRARR